MFKPFKGQGKAIELVIGLFVMIVVAVAVLSLFTGWLQKGTTRLEQITQQSMEEYRSECSQLCEQWRAQHCSPKALYGFCTKVFQIDLSGEGGKPDGDFSDYDDSKLGIGVCEDRVYCAHLYECKCDVGSSPINMGTCKSSLCSYLRTDLGMAATDATEKVQEFIVDSDNPAQCFRDSVGNNQARTSFSMLWSVIKLKETSTATFWTSADFTAEGMDIIPLTC